VASRPARSVSAAGRHAGSDFWQIHAAEPDHDQQAGTVPANGHFMMLENNRRQVFDVIRGGIEQKVPAKA
jgi:hypothetical protein